jgi:hypothetical protein
MTMVCLLFFKAVIYGLLLSLKEICSQCLETVTTKTGFKEHNFLGIRFLVDFGFEI